MKVYIWIELVESKGKPHVNVRDNFRFQESKKLTYTNPTSNISLLLYKP